MEGNGKMSSIINVEVTPRKNEDIERTLKRFIKKVKKESIIETVRERQYYEKPSVVKRKKKKQRKAALDKLKVKRETS
tara:strand:- start:605 stop:838 length:234 start_codon:yes stop_codon:yes gene_type:complete